MPSTRSHQLAAALGATFLVTGVLQSCSNESPADIDGLVEEAQSPDTAFAMQSVGDGLGARFDALERGAISVAVALEAEGEPARVRMRSELLPMLAADEDETLVIYAYLLGKAKDHDALVDLATFLTESEGSTLTIAPHAAADAIFAILDDPRRRPDTFDYGLAERDEAIAAALEAADRSNGTAQAAMESGARPSCQVKYVLADANGNPLTYQNAAGQTVDAAFECTQHNEGLIYGDKGGGYATLEQKMIAKVIAGGGTFVTEYDQGRPSKRYNCAGFSFRELSQGQSLNCHAPTMLQVLEGAGVLRKKAGAPAVGDKVFYRPKLGWFSWNAWFGDDPAPAHVAEVLSASGDSIVVRAPDNHSGVFDAAIDAPYFTSGAGENVVVGNDWTSDVYEWVGGAPPQVLSFPGTNADPRYCQDECGGCADDEVCLDGACVEKTPQTSCELRNPSCCPGQDNSCTAPDAACYCDEHCLEANDCCPDVCSTCGYCGGSQ